MLHRHSNQKQCFFRNYLKIHKIKKVGEIVEKKNNGRFASRQNNKIIIYVIDMVLYKVLEALPKIRQQDTRKEDIHQLKMFMTWKVSKYTIRSIVCEASCYSVTRSQGHSDTWSLGHLVTWSLSVSVTLWLGHLVT